MKRVFVTVGTTSFDELIEAVISPSVLQVLARKGYDTVTLQTGRGKELKVANSFHGIAVEHYNYKPSIQDDICDADLIISHSGAGSILEALEAQKSLLVVINQTLMGNHQLELAHKLATDKHLIYCKCSNLCETLENFEESNLQRYVPGEPYKFVDFLDKVMNYAT